MHSIYFPNQLFFTSTFPLALPVGTFLNLNLGAVYIIYCCMSDDGLSDITHTNKIQLRFH
jgi:hypothetical protein